MDDGESGGRSEGGFEVADAVAECSLGTELVVGINRVNVEPYTSVMNPIAPFIIMVKIMTFGRSFDALFTSSAMCAGASDPIKLPTLVIIPTRHATPALEY